MIVALCRKVTGATIILDTDVEVQILRNFLARLSRKEIARVMQWLVDSPDVMEISNLIDKLYDGLEE